MAGGISNWLCIACGHVLGEVLGGELSVSAAVIKIRTRGPNMVVVCPSCGAEKVWFTSDTITRAMHQLVEAIATVAARRMVEIASKEMLPKL